MTSLTLTHADALIGADGVDRYVDSAAPRPAVVIPFGYASTLTVTDTPTTPGMVTVTLYDGPPTSAYLGATSAPLLPAQAAAYVRDLTSLAPEHHADVSAAQVAADAFDRWATAHGITLLAPAPIPATPAPSAATTAATTDAPAPESYLAALGSGASLFGLVYLAAHALPWLAHHAR